VQAAIRNKVLLVGFAAIVILAIAAIIAYGSKKKRDLESSAAASVAAATVDLRQAGALALDAPDAAAKLQERVAGLDARVEALRGEDSSRNKTLAEAAELYLVEVRAILHNEAAAARALASSRASSRALEAHLQHAAARGPGWIDRALALKKKAERDNFDLRTAMGAVADLLHAHRDTQDKLRAAYPAAPMIDEPMRAALEKAAREAQDKAAQDLERLRRLPIA
jgi:hypothetical protein